MESIAVTKPTMGVLSSDRLPLSPFALLAHAFAEELLARAKQGEGSWSYIPLEFLFENDGKVPQPPAARPVIQVDLHLVLEALRREKEQNERQRVTERMIERVIRMQEAQEFSKPESAAPNSRQKAAASAPDVLYQLQQENHFGPFLVSRAVGMGEAVQNRGQTLAETLSGQTAAFFQRLQMQYVPETHAQTMYPFTAKRAVQDRMDSILPWTAPLLSSEEPLRLLEESCEEIEAPTEVHARRALENYAKAAAQRMAERMERTAGLRQFSSPLIWNALQQSPKPSVSADETGQTAAGSLLHSFYGHMLRPATAQNEAQPHSLLRSQGWKRSRFSGQVLPGSERGNRADPQSTAQGTVRPVSSTLGPQEESAFPLGMAALGSESVQTQAQVQQPGTKAVYRPGGELTYRTEGESEGVETPPHASVKPSRLNQKQETGRENPAEKQPLPTAMAHDIRTAKPGLETHAGSAGQGSALTPVQSHLPKVETTQAASKFQPPAGETVLLQSQPSSGEAVQAQVRFPAGTAYRSGEELTYRTEGEPEGAEAPTHASAKPSRLNQKQETGRENLEEKQPLPTAAAQDIRTAKPNLETRAGLAGQGSALTPVQSSPPKVETTQAASKFQPPAGETVLLQPQPSSGEAVQAQVPFQSQQSSAGAAYRSGGELTYRTEGEPEGAEALPHASAKPYYLNQKQKMDRENLEEKQPVSTAAAQDIRTAKPGLETHAGLAGRGSVLTPVQSRQPNVETTQAASKFQPPAGETVLLQSQPSSGEALQAQVQFPAGTAYRPGEELAYRTEGESEGAEALPHMSMKPSHLNQKRETGWENLEEKQPLPTAVSQDIRTAKPNLETRAGLAGQGSVLTPVQSRQPNVETTQAASKFQPPAGETVLLQSQPSSGEAVQAQVQFQSQQSSAGAAYRPGGELTYRTEGEPEGAEAPPHVSVKPSPLNQKRERSRENPAEKQPLPTAAAQDIRTAYPISETQTMRALQPLTTLELSSAPEQTRSSPQELPGYLLGEELAYRAEVADTNGTTDSSGAALQGRVHTAAIREPKRLEQGQETPKRRADLGIVRTAHDIRTAPVSNLGVYHLHSDAAGHVQGTASLAELAEAESQVHRQTRAAQESTQMRRFPNQDFEPVVLQAASGEALETPIQPGVLKRPIPQSRRVTSSVDERTRLTAPGPLELTYTSDQRAEESPAQAPNAGKPSAMEESDYVRKLPEWARRFLRGETAQSAQNMGVAKGIASLPQPPEGETIQWTAPNYRPPEAPITHREKPKGERLQQQTVSHPISDVELQRTADRVYRMIEDRIRRERRRLGF